MEREPPSGPASLSDRTGCVLQEQGLSLESQVRVFRRVVFKRNANGKQGPRSTYKEVYSQTAVVKTISQPSQDSNLPSSLSISLLENTSPNVNSNPELSPTLLLSLANFLPEEISSVALFVLGNGSAALEICIK